MREMSLQEVKSVQLDILGVVHKYCEKNNLRYYLGYGTLIGAVRHSGYIPWDDDIDIVMLRDDYEKFISHFNKYDKDYKVYTPFNCVDYKYPFAKVCYEKTRYIEDSNSIMPELGITLDLFPIDNMPDDFKKIDELINEQKRKKKILELCAISKADRGMIKNFLFEILQIAIKNINFNKIARDMNFNAQKYSNVKSNLCMNAVWSYWGKEITEKECYAQQLEYEFEGKRRYIPQGYDKLLTSIYGDYMKLPSKEKQIAHHYFKAYIDN